MDCIIPSVPSIFFAYFRCPSAVSNMASNLAVLTQSHTAVAAKKRAKREQIKEILFDDNARRCAVL